MEPGRGVWSAEYRRMTMRYPFTDAFDKQILLETMMGPNALRVSEEMASFLHLDEKMRVLDLGCGMGLSTTLLAKQYGCSLVAADLWISPTDNARRFEQLGILDRVVPLSLDATKDIPFAEDYFDVVFSVDSYHYYGNTPEMLPKLLRYLKPGGTFAVAVPGFAQELGGAIPPGMEPYWEDDMNFHTCAWWEELWKQADGFRVDLCREMDCFRQSWDEWLESSNPYAVKDRGMMEAGGYRYFNLVQIMGTKL